jgi:hypothetical protein
MKFEVGKTYVAEMLMVEPEGGMNPFTGEYGERFEKLSILQPGEIDLQHMEQGDLLVKVHRTDEVMFLDLNQSIEYGVIKVYEEVIA